MNIASTKKDWPLGRGFERFYGFLGAETNQWYPDLTYDNHSGGAAGAAGGGLPLLGRHHRQGALVHQGRQGGRARQAVLPLLRASAPPTPRTTCRQEWADKYKGKFDMGYEAYRELVFANQKKLGIVARARRAVADQPLHRAEGPEGQRLGRARRRAAVGLADRRREAPLLADGRGLRRASSATPTTSSDGCSTTSRRAASSTTR